MMCLSPRSTPFPYTTLFRSAAAAGRKAFDVVRAKVMQKQLTIGASDGNARPAAQLKDCAPGAERLVLVDKKCWVGVTHQNCPDRKSTRLNSSHLGISYAVFC